MDARHKRQQLWGIGMVFAVSATIFWFSAQNGEASSSLSDAVTVRLLKFLLPDLAEGSGLFEIARQFTFWVRKGAHYLIYCLLGLVCTYTATRNEERTVLKAGLFALIYCTVYAAGDELHQFFVPGRSAQLRDVALDTVGALSGILLFSWALHHIRKRRQTDKTGR